MNIEEFLPTIVVGGSAVTAIVQFLKSNFVKSQVFNKHPRLTTFIASITATVFAAFIQCKDIVDGCQSLFTQPIDYATAIIGVFLIAVTLYNNVLRDKDHL